MDKNYQMLDSRISSLEDKMASAFSLCYDYMSDMNNRNMQILDLMKNLQQTQAQILKQLSQQQQQSQFNQPQMMPTPLIVLEKDDQKETKKMDGKKDEKKDTKNTLTPQKFTGRPSKSYSDFSDLREMESKEMKTPKRWSEYVQTSGVDVSNLSKLEQNRQEVIFEVETTEQDYINDMVALQFFMKEISQAQLLSADDFKILFCNAPILCESNQKFLISLKSKRQESRMVSTVGDSFLILKNGFSDYQNYCQNHVKATKLLKKLLTNPEFRKTHDKIQFEKPEVKNLSLESYLIKPVQRICKYPLLIQEIRKFTDPSKNDSELLQQAAELMEENLKKINEAMPAADEEDQILMLNSIIESEEPLNLSPQDHHLLFQGNILVKINGQMKERFFVLFDDCLLVCKINKKLFSNFKYLLRYNVPTNQFLINAHPKNDPKDEMESNHFQFIWAGNLKFDVYCKTEQERNKLVSLFDKVSMGLYLPRKKSKEFVLPPTHQEERKRSSSFDKSPLRPLQTSNSSNHIRPPPPDNNKLMIPKYPTLPIPSSNEDAISAGRELNRKMKTSVGRKEGREIQDGLVDPKNVVAGIENIQLKEKPKDKPKEKANKRPVSQNTVDFF